MAMSSEVHTSSEKGHLIQPREEEWWWRGEVRQGFPKEKMLELGLER